MARRWRTPAAHILAIKRRQILQSDLATLDPAPEVGSVFCDHPLALGQGAILHHEGIAVDRLPVDADGPFWNHPLRVMQVQDPPTHGAPTALE